ncbi:MAG: MJ0042-type zinc finger domain-containing protein [Aquabacterium sp.]
MKLAEGIRRLGFRKWYERRLLASHGHMVLTFLSAIGFLAGAEAFMTMQSLADRLVDVIAVLVCAAVGYWAVRRYLYLLHHAEFVANQAHCPACATYGRLEVADNDVASGDVRVRCRKCQHIWTIHE